MGERKAPFGSHLGCNHSKFPLKLIEINQIDSFTTENRKTETFNFSSNNRAA